jgi:MFS family permease
MGERLLTHDSVLLLFSTFLNSIPVGYINVVPLVYLAEIGYDPSTIGVIYSVSAIALTIGLIPSGLLADRYSRKKLLIVGTALPCVSYAIFGLTLDPLPLTLASIIGGIGFAGGLGGAITSPTLIPMLANSTSDNKRSTLFGVLQSAWAVAFTIGAALSFLPSLFSSSFAQSERAAHFDSYFIMLGVAAVSVIPLFFVKERRNGGDPQRSSGSNAAVPQLTRGKRSYFSGVSSWSKIAKFSIIFAFTGFGLGVLVQLLPTWYAMRFGASEGIIGIWIAVSNLATIVSIPMIPMLVSRRGTISTAVATGIIGALVLAFMPFAAVFEMAAAIFAIRSIVSGLSWAVLQSYMMGVVSEGERGTMVGFAYTAWGVGISLGVLIGGEFLGVGLLSLPFVAAIISYLISSAAVLIFFRRIKPPEELLRFSLPRVTE